MKTCRKCGVEKSYEEFCKRHVCPDGYDTWCKPCRTAYARFNRAKPENRARNAARCKARQLAKPEYYRKYIREYYKDHRDEIKAQVKRWYQENRQRAKQVRLEWYLKNKDSEEYKARAAASQRRYLANKGRKTARVAANACVYQAIKAGVMQRKPCEVCGSTVEVHAHHYKGYEQEHWFDVQWLCRKHHNDAHGKRTH